MTLPTPYYEADGITIFCGDCRDILPGLEPVDLVLTDPPYGIGADAKQGKRANKQHGAAAAPSKDYGESNWDNSPPDMETINAAISHGCNAIVWGGNYFSLPPSPAWLVWNKQTGSNGYADAELAWSNLSQAVRMLTHRWMGMLKDNCGDDDARTHPM